MPPGPHNNICPSTSSTLPHRHLEPFSEYNTGGWRFVVKFAEHMAGVRVATLLAMMLLVTGASSPARTPSQRSIAKVSLCQCVARRPESQCSCGYLHLTGLRTADKPLAGTMIQPETPGLLDDDLLLATPILDMHDRTPRALQSSDMHAEQCDGMSFASGMTSCSCAHDGSVWRTVGSGAQLASLTPVSCRLGRQN